MNIDHALKRVLQDITTYPYLSSSISEARRQRSWVAWIKQLMNKIQVVVRLLCCSNLVKWPLLVSRFCHSGIIETLPTNSEDNNGH
ncbi:hypothetical protein Hdeb2414_s0006g00214531 [Helianthus debilis subsp. tardiflorus]